MRSRLGIGIACIAVCVGLAACPSTPVRVAGFPIGGYQAPELAQSTDGILSIWDKHDPLRLRIVTPASATETSIALPPGALAVSGPARNGTVAVLQAGQGGDAEKSITLVGPTPREIPVNGIRRDGQVRIALSPSGQRLAVALSIHEGAWLEQLRVYSTSDASMELSVDDRFVGNPLIWFDDGRILYQTDDNPGEYPKHVGVTSLDVASGGRWFLPSAFECAPGREGVSYLAARRGGAVQEVFLDGNIVNTYGYLPGLTRYGLLGVTREGRVVYQALAADWETTETFGGGWGLTGPDRRWTVKVSDGVSGAYATLADMIGGTVEYRRSSP